MTSFTVSTKYSSCKSRRKA